MRSRTPILSAVGILLVAGLPAWAQSLQTGSLIGSVRDKAGQPVPGAKVRLQSGQTERTTMTNDRGEYRFQLLNVGEWSITVSHSRFQTIQTKTRISINDTQTGVFTLAPVAGTLIEVVASASDLDTTQSQVTTSLDAEQLAQLPMDMTSLNALDGLMGAIPGVQVAYTGAFNVMGGTDGENVFTVDGNVTNKTYTNGANAGSWLASTQPAREFLESVEVVTSGFGAEYGPFGGVVNALSKSGSNTWTGSVFYATNFPHSQAAGFYNPKSTPAQKKPVDPDKYHRYGATVSGPILKDKLFFFLGYQGFRDVIPPTTLNTGSTNWDGLKSDDAKATGPNQVTAKINWFINSENQLILSGTHSKYETKTGNQYFDYGTVNDGIIRTATSQNVNLTWNWMPRSDFFLVASVGRFQNPSKWGPLSGADVTTLYVDYRYFLDGPGSTSGRLPPMPAYVAYMTGNGTGPRSYTNNPNTQVRLDLSWNRGDHQVRAGFMRQDTSYETDTSEENFYIITNPVLNGTYFGDPGELDRMHQGANHAKYGGILRSYYLKDIWEPLPGLRVDAGLRYDPFVYKGEFAPFSGVTLERFEHFRQQLQPRLGIVWDVDRDGRKKVFAHFGRFFMAMPMSAVSWAKSSAMSLDGWFTGSWAYNPAYGSGQIPFTLKSPAPDLSIPMSVEGKPSPVATDLRLPHKNTWTLGSDWNVGNNWTVGVLWVYWDLKDALDDSWFLNPDGSAALPSVTSKVIWNPRPGPVSIRNSDGQTLTWNSDFPDPKDRYVSLNLHARHQGERHFLAVDYTWVHHYGNYQGEESNNLVYSTSNSTLNFGTGGQTGDFDYARGITSGNYEANPVHEVKARAGYRFTVWGQDLNVGSVLSWRSGFGQTRTMLAGGKWRVNSSDQTFAGNGTDVVSVNGQRGDMGHSPSVLLVNLDLGASIKAGRMTIKPNVAITNFFNARPVLGNYAQLWNGATQASLAPNPNYGLAYAGQGGRAITAGLSLQF